MVVTRVGLGGIPIIRQSFWRSEKIVHKALDLGINFIDTARAYQDSEQKIGNVMKTRRSECFLASKTHFRTAQESMDALETSLKDLQTDYLDLWQLHDISTQDRWDQVFGPDGAFEALEKAQKQGKVRYLGVTGHNVPMLIDLVKTDKFSTILTCYNVMITEPENELIPLARDKGIGVIVMKPNAGGLPFRAVYKKETNETEPSKITPRETMRFVLSNPGVDCALAGPKLVKEIVEDYKIADNYELTKPEERQEMIRYAQSIYNPRMPLCLGCGYCDECPQGIPVSKIMLLLQDVFRLPVEWPRQRKEYAKLRPDVEACTDCGKCEEKCPQNLNIRERLQKAKQRLDRPV